MDTALLEILEETRMETIAMVTRRRMLELVGHVKRSYELENIRAVAEMKMEGSAIEEDRSCGGKTLSEGT